MFRLRLVLGLGLGLVTFVSGAWDDLSASVIAFANYSVYVWHDLFSQFWVRSSVMVGVRVKEEVLRIGVKG